MVLSTRIRQLTDRAQKMTFPKEDPYDRYVSLTICPVSDGSFQVWLDKWQTIYDGNTHLGLVGEQFVEGETLVLALNNLEILLDETEEEQADLPETVQAYGCTYKLVK